MIGGVNRALRRKFLCSKGFTSRDLACGELLSTWVLITLVWAFTGTTLTTYIAPASHGIGWMTTPEVHAPPAPIERPSSHLRPRTTPDSRAAGEASEELQTTGSSCRRHRTQHGVQKPNSELQPHTSRGSGFPHQIRRTCSSSYDGMRSCNAVTPSSNVRMNNSVD